MRKTHVSVTHVGRDTLSQPETRSNSFIQNYWRKMLIKTNNPIYIYYGKITKTQAQAQLGYSGALTPAL